MNNDPDAGISSAGEPAGQSRANGDDGTPSMRSHTDGPDAEASFYVVDHYDESRDPAVDLQRAILRARTENKRILVQVGGDWCDWCHRMTHFFATNESVRKTLSDHFLIMKVAYADEPMCRAFLEPYPEIDEYPHLFVLDRDGNLLLSQATAELEKDEGYNQERFQEFLAAFVIED